MLKVPSLVEFSSVVFENSKTVQSFQMDDQTDGQRTKGDQKSIPELSVQVSLKKNLNEKFNFSNK